MSKLKLPIIILLVAAAAAAGLVSSGTIGSSDADPASKHVIEPIGLSEPFTINLRDTQSTAFLAMNIAVQLEPMDDVEWAAFSGGDGGGHGGGAAEAPGPAKVASYPKFRHAVITVASTFSSSQLLTPEGKSELQAALLDKFNEIAETDAAEAKAGADADNEAHVGPPFHVMEVLFTKYVVQP